MLVAWRTAGAGEEEVPRELVPDALARCPAGRSHASGLAAPRRSLPHVDDARSPTPAGSRNGGRSPWPAAALFFLALTRRLFFLFTRPKGVDVVRDTMKA